MVDNFADGRADRDGEVKKKLTKFELQMKVSALKSAEDRAKKDGHLFIARECSKAASVYKRRIKRMEAKELR